MTVFLGLVENVITKGLSNDPEIGPYVYHHVCLQHYLETHLVEMKQLLEVNERESHRIIIMVSFSVRGRRPDPSTIIF